MMTQLHDFIVSSAAALLPLFPRSICLGALTLLDAVGKTQTKMQRSTWRPSLACGLSGRPCLRHVLLITRPPDVAVRKQLITAEFVNGILTSQEEIRGDPLVCRRARRRAARC